MELRLATKKDFERFFPIKEEFFKEYGISKKSREFIFKEFERYIEEGVIILSLENNEVIGYLTGEIEENPYERVGYISEIFIKKEYRRKGIATKLKDKFLEFLKRKRIELCRIDVNSGNPAQEVYKKWGFKIDKYRMSLKL